MEELEAKLRMVCAQNGISPLIAGGLARYVNHRIPTGSFLNAVLSNDLNMACRLADTYNRERLWFVWDVCRQGVPEEAWGSPEAVRKWLNGGS